MADIHQKTLKTLQDLKKVLIEFFAVDFGKTKCGVYAFLHASFLNQQSEKADLDVAFVESLINKIDKKTLKNEFIKLVRYDPCK